MGVGTMTATSRDYRPLCTTSVPQYDRAGRLVVRRRDGLNEQQCHALVNRVAAGESLRNVAAAYNISHEQVRRIIRMPSPIGDAGRAR